MKRVQIDNSEKLKTRSFEDKRNAEQRLEEVKKLNRPVKFLKQGFSYNWEKEKQKIDSKKY